jgi:SAM-dependent methyltransferase
MKKVSEVINNQFWNLAFKTGVYDFVVMSSYDHSLKTIADSSNLKPQCHVLDVGCGSGRLLLHIGDKLKETGSLWTGLELTPGGISACKSRISSMGLQGNARVLPANMCQSLPLERESVDVAIAHFSMYVIPDREMRILAFKNIAEVLKKNGMIYIASPGKNYNAKDLVRSSLAIDKTNPDLSLSRKLWNKLMFSTLGHMSEVMVANRIQKGVWCGFSKEEMENEASEAGLTMQRVKDIYGDTSLMATFCK